jgi:hypothetical protein
MSLHSGCLFAAASIAAAVAAAPRPAGAQEIVWNVADAKAVGNGCSSAQGDTAFITFGNDVAVLFSKFGVDLQPGGSSPALAALKNCNVRIPATLRGGRKILELTQRITFGVVKSESSDAEIRVHSTAFGNLLTPMNVGVGAGAKQDPAVVHMKKEQVSVTGACSHDMPGNLVSNMSVSGKRSSASESLLLAMEGLDLRYDLVLSVAPCGG